MEVVWGREVQEAGAVIAVFLSIDVGRWRTPRFESRCVSKPSEFGAASSVMTIWQLVTVWIVGLLVGLLYSLA
jgi:hypothetical protein